MSHGATDGMLVMSNNPQGENQYLPVQPFIKSLPGMSHHTVDKMSSYMLDITPTRREGMAVLNEFLVSKGIALHAVQGIQSTLNDLLTLAANLYVHELAVWSRSGYQSEEMVMGNFEPDLYGIRLRFQDVIGKALPDVGKSDIVRVTDKMTHTVGRAIVKLVVSIMGNNSPCHENFISSQPAYARSIHTPLLVTVSTSLRSAYDEF